jgi:hypothetical protein
MLVPLPRDWFSVISLGDVHPLFFRHSPPEQATITFVIITAFVGTGHRAKFMDVVGITVIRLGRA